MAEDIRISKPTADMIRDFVYEGLMKAYGDMARRYGEETGGDGWKPLKAGNPDESHGKRYIRDLYPLAITEYDGDRRYRDSAMLKGEKAVMDVGAIVGGHRDRSARKTPDDAIRVEADDGRTAEVRLSGPWTTKSGKHRLPVVKVTVAEWGPVRDTDFD